MDVFDKRDFLLNQQIEMLAGKIEADELLLALIHFENCCGNGGLSRFAEDFRMEDLTIIEAFAKEEKITTVENMINVLKAFINRYRLGFIDCLDHKEYQELSKHDDAFFEINDEYTDKLYKRVKGSD